VLRSAVSLILATQTALFAAGATTALAGEALAYLEGLKGKSRPYLAPSEVDARFTVALYVNVATEGPNKQRMWVLHRDRLGGDWRLAMWDLDFWKQARLADGAEPAYSWPVSTGRVYKGDRKSGPTPTGIFGIDERKWRYAEGHVRTGMIHVMHIDHHTADGRVSGVAFHGTPAGNYRRLGTNDSHGCIRMHQKNALALLNRLTGLDGTLTDFVRWGEVPRYWASEERRVRSGYRTDGMAIPAPVVEASAEGSSSAAPGTGSDSSPSAAPPASTDGILTKTGFRAIAVIFED
jgi:hypothetical protein